MAIIGGIPHFQTYPYQGARSYSSVLELTSGSWESRACWKTLEKVQSAPWIACQKLLLKHKVIRASRLFRCLVSKSHAALLRTHLLFPLANCCCCLCGWYDYKTAPGHLRTKLPLIRYMYNIYIYPTYTLSMTDLLNEMHIQLFTVISHRWNPINPFHWWLLNSMNSFIHTYSYKPLYPASWVTI